MLRRGNGELNYPLASAVYALFEGVSEMKPPLYCVLLLSWLMSVQAMAQSLFDGAWKIDLNESAPSTILQRTDPFPATGVGGNQAKIIDPDLRRESCVAFVAVGEALQRQEHSSY